ncbi:hypothetical protein FHS59_000449 [Algoriphagus iocasae]|uniref:Uncharacterized protein n=1 Tax=Algoriphagus iocasae TaxID=1836499 RepID=A0A841MIY8_9BACT|nr:hypothetical protein [Algoriphagus iocasae]MBB6324834.1 hypothetical protein [Algoriphagus iocasae]
MRFLSVFLLIAFPHFSFSQENNVLDKAISEITVSNLDLVSFDTKDQIFASTNSGDIYQFQASGKQLNLFSPTRQGRLQQLEAAWTVNIFSFSSDLQEYRILDRFLNLLSENGFFQANINLAKAATLGNNNIIWVWDESDLNLKILDYRRNTVIQSQPLNIILNPEKLEVTEIREFKNRLFMNVKGEGIFMFDNQGNFIKKINLVTDQRLCFYNENLLWLNGEMVMAISLQNQEKIEIGSTGGKDFESISIGQEKIALITQDKIKVFDIPVWIKSLQ